MGGRDLYSTWAYTKLEPLARIEFVCRTSAARDLSRTGLEQCLDKMAASLADLQANAAAASR